MSECGPDPMLGPPTPVDRTRAMTVTLRYRHHSGRRSTSAARRIDRRETRRVPTGPARTMSPATHHEIEQLRERVRRSEYVVDAQAVAAAILARLHGDAQLPGEPRT